MQNPNDNAGARLVPGTFAAGEREELVAYLVKNFGPDSKKRGLEVPDEPIDEKALGKAMFIEYHIPPLANGQRGFHDAHLSQNGDIWYVDARGLQVGKMDPRTSDLDRLPCWRPAIPRPWVDAGRERRYLDGGPHGFCEGRQQDWSDQILSVRYRSQTASARQYSICRLQAKYLGVSSPGPMKLPSMTTLPARFHSTRRRPTTALPTEW